MSIRKAFDRCRKALNEIARQPRLLLSTALIYGLFVWTQDMVPLIGPILSSIAVTFLMARLFAPGAKVRIAPLLALGFLWFPINLSWLVISSLYQNGTWQDVLSIGWTIPLIMTICLALTTHAIAVRLIVLEGKGVDTALKEAWVKLTKKFGTEIPVWSFMTFFFVICFLLKGAAFPLSIPYGLALLKVSAEE